MKASKKPITMLVSHRKTLKALVNLSIQQKVRDKAGEQVDNDIAVLPDGMIQITHPCQRILNYSGDMKKTTVFYALRFLVEQGVIFKVGRGKNIICVKFDPKVLSRWDITTARSLPKKLKSENKPEPKKEKEAPVEEKEINVISLEKLEERARNEKAIAINIGKEIESLEEKKELLQCELERKDKLIISLETAISALKELRAIDS